MDHSPIDKVLNSENQLAKPESLSILTLIQLSSSVEKCGKYIPVMLAGILYTIVLRTQKRYHYVEMW